MSVAIRAFQGKFGRIALLDMDRPLVTHAHSQCHVLIKAGGEDTCFSVQDKTVPLTDDNIVLINSWEPHAYTHRPNAPRTIILGLYIEPTWLIDIEKAFITSGTPGFFPMSGVQMSPTVRRLSSALAVELFYGAELAGPELEERLFSLMIAVIESFAQWRTLNLLRNTALPAIPDHRIRRAIAYMKANIGAELDINTLAAQACLSRAHFFKLFQQSTNVTPIVYANVLRMEAAIQRVAQMEDSLTQVSETLGFSAPSHFTRFFHQHIGATPSQYRKVVDVVAQSSSTSKNQTQR
jgi:AraC-like DNA-binding protein